MLKINNLSSGYTEGNSILKGVDLSVDKNEAVAIIGQNGAGKSTLAKAIVNMLPYISGEISLGGELLVDKSTYEIINNGISYFLQGGRIFPHLTVDENIKLAGIGLSKSIFQKRKENIFSYFNFLNGNRQSILKLQASYLSGGEKHQLALAMVLMQKPKLLILDEPSAGLAPGNVKQLYESLNKIREQEKLSILLIEQNVRYAVDFCDKIFILSNGRIMENENSELSTME